MLLFLNGRRSLGLRSLYSKAVSVWSFRKMVPSYTGNCIQMSDGTDHTDIGWLPEDDNGDVWVDGLALFDALSEGKTGVRTWYDQAGNANLTQRSFSTSVGPITVDMSATPAGTPAVMFGAPASTTNALHDDTNSGALTDFFSGGGMFSMVGSFDENATNGSYIWSKGAGSTMKYHNSSVLRMANDFSSTDSIFHNSPLDNTANNWWNILISYNSDDVANIPSWQVDDNEYGIGKITRAPVGSYVSDSSEKFSIGNRSPGGFGSLSGYISEFAIWDEIL